MSYVSGDSHSRKKILLFTIGLVIFFSFLSISSDLAVSLNMPWLVYLRVFCFVGLAIELVAIFKMRQYDDAYTICAIGSIVVAIAVLLGYGLHILKEIGVFKGGAVDTFISIFSLVDTIAECVVMCFFFSATNRLANQSYHGMNTLTKILIVAYIFLAVIQTLVFLSEIFHFTITNDFVGTLLQKLVSISSLIQYVGTFAFLICAMVYIKD